MNGSRWLCQALSGGVSMTTAAKLALSKASICSFHPSDANTLEETVCGWRLDTPDPQRSQTMLPENRSRLSSSLHKPQGEMAHSCKLLNLARDPGLMLGDFHPQPLLSPLQGTCKPCTRHGLTEVNSDTISTGIRSEPLFLDPLKMQGTSNHQARNLWSVHSPHPKPRAHLQQRD